MGRRRWAAACSALLAAAALAVAACTPARHAPAPDSRAPAPPPGTTRAAAPVPVEPVRTLDACSLLSAKAFRAVAPSALLAYDRSSYGYCSMTATGTSHPSKESSGGLTTVYHVSVDIAAAVKDPRDLGWPGTDWQSPRTVAGLTAYPGTVRQPPVCQRVIALAHGHAVAVDVKSVDTLSRNCAYADAATHSAVDAVTHGTVRHLRWRSGSPATIPDLCHVLSGPVRDVFGSGVTPVDGTGPFRCTWRLPGAAPASGTVPPQVRVGLLAGAFPPRPPGSTGAPAQAATTTVSGHRALCQNPQSPQRVDGYCQIDFGSSAFPGEHVLVAVRVLGHHDVGTTSHADGRVRALAAAVTATLDSRH